MKIDIIATTHPNYVSSRDDFDNFSGKAAGVCYMKQDFETLKNEPVEKTLKRIQQTKIGGHHSVYDHEYISFYFEDIPKALAIVLNNERMYTTSEKSARYTKMVLDDKVQILYDKWVEIFKKQITDRYKTKYPDYFTDLKIQKLAQENARYLISVFTPTSMVYTMSYRQLNYIYGFLQDEIENPNSNEFYKHLKPAMIDFCKALEKTEYLDDALIENGKNRKLSLISDYVPVEYFGDVYSTSHLGSFAQFAQAHRHRTLKHSITLLDNDEYYVPPIIAKNEELKQEWLNDIKNSETIFPQGMLIKINEMGTFDDFVLKMMERKCSAAQLEINQQTNQTLLKYYNALKEQNHPRADELKNYMHGARCTFPNFQCKDHCHFAEGINEEREI